jgi:predicted DNA-binding protein (UPF0251 family)
MPRPVKPRLVSKDFEVSIFGPLKTPPTGEVCLSVEGMEALRLSDHEGMDQDGAAGLMGVSRQTYGRILAEARGAVAHALVAGKVLRVEGGNYQLRGGGHRRMRRRGQAPPAGLRKGGEIMPRGDGTGPDGQGPAGRGRGGRGRGQCNAPGGRPGGGPGGRKGQGRGRGSAGSSGQAPTSEEKS